MKFTTKEDEFIKNNYLNMTDKEIGKYLGRTAKSVNTHRNNYLKLTKQPKNKILNYNNKHTDEYIEKFINNLGYILISDKYENNRQKLVLSDENGYYYYITFDSLYRGSKPPRFHKSNPYTIQNIKLWCKLNNKSFELLSNKYNNKEIKLKWKCLKNNCGEEFWCDWNNIRNGKGCGICHGKQVSLLTCLATKRPELVKEWHPIKNGNLTPYNVTEGCNKEVWWQCSKNPEHEWKSVISSRTRDKAKTTNCPYCTGLLPSKEYNLLVLYSELCKEWDYNKNKNKPEDYCPNSGDYVWWRCLECNHNWKTRIADRSGNGRGCPKCSASNGEKKIKEIFNIYNFIKILQEEYFNLNNLDKINNIYYIWQKEFDGLIGLGNGLLSYDFYLPQYNLLIEYQGEQHEKYIKGFHKSKKDFEKQVEHDRRKKEYAKINNINLLEIWYWDYNNIECILNEYLNNNKIKLVNN